jgi:5'-nucleotidase
MEQQDAEVALVDLDGTVADYDGAMQTAMGFLRAPGEPLFDGWDDVPPFIEARRNLIKRQPGFWRTLPQHPLGFEIIEELRTLGFLLHVLTKGPTKTTPAWTEKVEWCQENLPDALVTVTQNKSLVYGKVLVDDYPPYFTGWMRHRPRGLVVCVAQTWNADWKGVPNVLRYDGKNRDQLREALQRAKERKSGEELVLPGN